MLMRGENLRFWLPVGLLAVFAVYTSQKLVRAHVDPSVDAPDYTFKKELPGCRGKIFGALGTEYPLAKSIPVWEYRLDPVALTNIVVKKKGEPPRTRDEIVHTIAYALGLDFEKVRKMALNTQNRYQYLSTSSDSVGAVLPVPVLVGSLEYSPYTVLTLPAVPVTACVFRVAR